MSIANVVLTDTFQAWINKTNLLVQRVNTFDTTAIVTNLVVNGHSGIFNANAVVKGTAVFQRNVTANGNAIIINANTVAKGTAVFQRNVTVNSNALAVSANATFSGRTIVSGPLLKVNSSTIHHNSVTANGNYLLSHANVITRGTLVAQGDITANGNNLRVHANTIQNGTLVINGTLVSNGASATFKGANTNVRGQSLFVSANTVITGSAFIANTLVASKGSPIKSIGYGSNTYTLDLVDNGRYLRAANTGGMTVTIPSNGTAAIPIGAEIVVVRTGGNNHLLFANAAGVTMNYADGKRRIASRYAAATLKKVDTNEWDLIGALSE